MVSIKLIKKNGKLIFVDNKEKLAYQIFLDKIKEGQKLEMYIDLADADHSKAQLAKVHACIRELAKESGYTFEEMKALVKESSGLGNKSFADASKDDLMLAIEACIEIGKELNVNLQ